VVNRKIDLFGLVLGAMLAAGCGSAAGAVEPSSSGQQAPSATTAFAAPTQRDLEALQSAASGVDLTGVVSLEVTQPPAEVHQEDAWLRVELSATDGPGYVDQFWRAMLVAGNFNAASNPLGVSSLSGTTIESPSDGKSISVMRSQRLKADGGRAEALQRATDGAAAVGLKIRSLSVSDDGTVIRLVAETDDPKAFLLRYRYAAQQIFGDLNRYDGTFLEVQSAAGDPVVVSAYSAGTGQGAGWADTTLVPACAIYDLDVPCETN
jgi:hypothetical protein